MLTEPPDYVLVYELCQSSERSSNGTEVWFGASKFFSKKELAFWTLHAQKMKEDLKTFRNVRILPI